MKASNQRSTSDSISRIYNLKEVWALALALTIGLAWQESRAVAQAADCRDPRPQIMPPHAHFGGRTLVEWAIAHFQWVFSIPADQNPILDGEDCENCSRNQSGPVWGLVPGPGIIERYCTVPVGKFIFVPAHGSWCSLLEGTGTTEAELRECAVEDDSLIVTELLEVDGWSVENLSSFAVTTPLFQVVWPEDSVTGMPAGADFMVVSGTYVILAPLSKGQHTIHRHVESIDGWMSDITWHLTVE